MTSKQRAMLRSMANTMETILYVGKEGVTPGTVKEAYDALEARELIKGAVQPGAPSPPRKPWRNCAARPARNLCSKSAAGSSSTAPAGKIPALCWNNPIGKTKIAHPANAGWAKMFPACRRLMLPAPAGPGCHPCADK